MKSRFKKITIALLAVVGLYIGGYFTLMSVHMKAVDKDGEPKYSSGFIFSATTNDCNGIINLKVCWANRFFLPIDSLWRQMRGLPPSERYIWY
jgi:hypothetical protein